MPAVGTGDELSDTMKELVNIYKQDGEKALKAKIDTMNLSMADGIALLWKVKGAAG